VKTRAFVCGENIKHKTQNDYREWELFTKEFRYYSYLELLVKWFVNMVVRRNIFKRSVLILKKIGLVLLILILGSYLYIGAANKIDIDMASKVEDNLYRPDGPIKISENFDGYFLMSNYDGSKIPILLSLSFDYNDIENGIISDSIKNIQANFNGIDGKIQLEKYEDTEYYYNIVFNIEPDNDEFFKIIKPKSQEYEIAFLKKKFKDDIMIKKINDVQITYEVKKSLGYYRVSIDFMKDIAKDEIIMRVRDRGTVRVVE